MVRREASCSGVAVWNPDFAQSDEADESDFIFSIKSGACGKYFFLISSYMSWSKEIESESISEINFTSFSKLDPSDLQIELNAFIDILLVIPHINAGYI